jgi:hypothetical protein
MRSSVLWLGWLLASTAAANTTPAAFFREANRAYQEGRYAEAVDGYQRAERAGGASADLFYNLGTAYYRLGRLGPAILAFEKALARAPRHEDARANLAVARRQAQLDKAEQELSLPREGVWARLSRSVSSDEVALVFLTLYYLFFLALAVRHFLRPGATRSITGFVALVLLVLVLAAGGFFSYRVYRQERVTEGILLEGKVALMEPHAGSWKSVRSLPEGLRVRILGRSEKWVEIRLSDGLSGYVREGQVGAI